MCRQAAAAQLKAQKLEEELQRLKAEAAEQVQRAIDEVVKEKKQLEEELKVEKTKVKNNDELLKSVCEGKTRALLEIINRRCKRSR